MYEHLFIGAFHGCTALQSIIIPSSITSMGNGTFRGALNLVSVTFLAASIPHYAFINCDRLTSITLSNEVTSIGKIIITTTISQFLLY